MMHHAASWFIMNFHELLWISTNYHDLSTKIGRPPPKKFRRKSTEIAEIHFPRNRPGSFRECSWAWKTSKNARKTRFRAETNVFFFWPGTLPRWSGVLKLDEIRLPGSFRETFHFVKNFHVLKKFFAMEKSSYIHKKGKPLIRRPSYIQKNASP